MDKKPRQLTAEEFEALDYDTIRCITCTPCCMSHVHLIYEGKVLWACQTKIERREEQS